MNQLMTYGTFSDNSSKTKFEKPGEYCKHFEKQQYPADFGKIQIFTFKNYVRFQFLNFTLKQYAEHCF